MTVRPTEEMYGKKVGIIIEARGLPRLGTDTNESICLEGVLSKECMPTTGADDNMFNESCDPRQITLENGVKAPNMGRNTDHPFCEGVPRITVDNSYVIGMYEPKKQKE